MDEMMSIQWWHKIPIGLDANNNLLFTPGRAPHYNHKDFGIPDDLSGKTILDIGAWDGFFTWACEKLGADVTSIDTNSGIGTNWGGPAGYEFCKRVLDAKARLIFPLSIYDLPIEMHNQFDLVLNFGVIYHLLHPMLALEKTFQATKPGGMAIIETAYDAGDITWGPSSSWSLWRNFDGDSGNFFFPTIDGLKNALEICGFVDCQHTIPVPPPFLEARVKKFFLLGRCVILIDRLPELTAKTERLLRPGRCVMTARKP